MSAFRRRRDMTAAARFRRRDYIAWMIVAVTVIGTVVVCWHTDGWIWIAVAVVATAALAVRRNWAC